MLAHDTLAIIWFGLWGLIWTVYFVLDGYSLGTGMLYPFIAKNDTEERQLQDSIGPFWGGNEVWLITAGGATFAAFPLTYALMFSYLYTPLMIILFALFFRATGLEFMHKHHTPTWKKTFKWAFTISSFIIAWLFGVAFANMYKGLPFDDKGYYGSLLSLLHPYGILGGILFVSLFLLSGALWIAMKTEGDVKWRSIQFTKKIWVAAAAVVSIFFVATSNTTSILANFVAAPVLWMIPGLSFVTILLVGYLVKTGKIIASFISVSLTILTLSAIGFIGLFPNMLLSCDPRFHVTLFEAAGSQLNLQLMLIVAIIFVPVVIAYQIIMLRIFRSKITPDNAKGYK